MSKTRRETTDERLYAAAEDAFTSEGGRPLPAQPELERQMAELRIGYDGLRYEYNGYRYDRLADAQAYARLMRSTAGENEPAGPNVARAFRAPPTDAQKALMTTLAIRCEGGAYRYEGFRYERLSDAVDYARLTRGHPDRGRA